MQKTILIVDDDDGMLRILRIVFERAKFDVLVASDGDQALQMIRKHRPDAVLMDDMMPGTAGTQVCKIVKHDPDTRLTPIVIYSAGPDMLNRAYLQEIGANAALRKPCDHRIIVETILHSMSAPV